MTTMRRWLDGMVFVSAVLLISTLSHAAETRVKRTPVSGPEVRGIDKVTDGNGRPVDLMPFVMPENVLAADPQSQFVKRGRAWWPYAAALPNVVGRRVEAMTENDILVNGTALLDVRDMKESLAAAPKELLLEADSQLAAPEGFYLIKLQGFSRTQVEVDALTQAGAVLGEYINVNTYIAKIPSSAFGAVRSLPFVTFVADYQPAFKISPRIGLEDIPVAEAVDAATGEAKPWVFEVTLHKGVYVNDVLNALAQLQIFPEDNDIVSNDALTFIRVQTVPDAVPALSMIPGVKFIAEQVSPQLYASATNPATIPMILQNNGAYTTNSAIGWKLWNAGIDGTGQVVTMMDSGLNTKMEHFAHDTTLNGTPGPTHRKVVGYDAFGGGDVCVLDTLSGDGGHGAKTSQHALGSISNMTTNPDVAHTPNANWDNGIARGAKLYFQDIGTSAGSISPPGDLGPSITAAIAKGSFVQNHSWGAANNLYDTSASNLDTALVANPNVVVTVSSGNRGAAGINSLGSPSTAKNSICVGGNDVAHPDNLFIDCFWDGVAACSGANDLGSSRGPVTGAGRIKPDIMAFIWADSAIGGEQMAISRPSAMCQTDPTKTVYFDYDNLGDEGGTSFAAPEVAGLAALVRNYFMSGYYPTGSAVPGNAFTPAGALVKAVVLASGEDMAANAYPSTTIAIGKRYSSDVGYGRANLPGALHVGNGAPFLWVQNNDNVGDGGSKTFFYNINGNTTPLRVMMTYYDAAGDALQKDVDLKVTIGGNVYWGNNFLGGWSRSDTANRDHTNNTEGVFLDLAHGLPASGTVRVDILGFNNPGGLNYSLAVVGDVASQLVTQVSLDKLQYTCNQPIEITVNDAAATSPVSVTLVSRNSVSAIIDTEIVSCTGSNGVFSATVQAGSGITVADGGSLTATYVGAIAPAVAGVSCQVGASDLGLTPLLSGGCDNATSGTDTVSGPLTAAGFNEFYTKYMDAGEATSYTFKFKNTTGVALTDVSVALSFSGAAASKMSVYNSPIHIGSVPVDAVVGGVFQVLTDATASALSSVNMDFDITSAADGYTAPKRVTQAQLLQANDQVTRQHSCSTFNTSLGGMAESVKVTRGSVTALNTWHWAGPTQATGAELRLDGACGDATTNATAMTGGALTGSNFNNNADSMLYAKFQPVLRGNGPSGQPYHYMWKWHSFYHATETLGNQSGVWTTFYSDRWNNPVNPTGDEILGFPISYLPPGFAFPQSVLDYVGTWNWDAPNAGIPDDPHFGVTTGGAPNQLILSFTGVTGLAQPTTYFAYGHEHADIFFFNGGTSHGTHRDIALDNDRLVYDQWYTEAQPGASCGGGGQNGVVAFGLSDYTTCPNGSAVLSVLDPNGVSGMQVTVTSPGSGDHELVTLVGSAPYFSGTVNMSTNNGVGANNGLLFVLPNETINASYTDGAPVGTSVAFANTGCTGGNVVYVANAQIVDNGDNDGIPDNNETVTIDLTIQNNLAVPLTNTKVKIFPNNANVDCIGDAESLYGTVAAGASKTNAIGDRFTFHVAPAVACADPVNPPVAQFIVVITGDGIDGPASLQTFNLNLDLDPTASGGPYNILQNFSTDPGWTTNVTPDDTVGSGCPPFTNDFHWCSACGNASGGYGAWVGNSPFGTSGQNYQEFGSSTLYSPALLANGNVGLTFDLAYRTENGFDGAIAQFRINAGAWTDAPFTTPAQVTLTSQEFCSPFLAAQTGWTGTATGINWNTTDPLTVPTNVNDTIQFRWRLGSDSSIVGSGYGGLGIDNVSITGLKQTVACEPTRNVGLAPCTFCQLNPVGTSCNDGNACTSGDVCTAGACAGTPVTTPSEAQSVSAAPDKTTFTWAALPNATAYDALHGLLSALPVGPGGGDETCFPGLASPTFLEPTTPAPGTGLFILVRGKNTCAGAGTYGTQKNGTPRISTTCP